MLRKFKFSTFPHALVSCLRIWSPHRKSNNYPRSLQIYFSNYICTYVGVSWILGNFYALFLWSAWEEANDIRIGQIGGHLGFSSHYLATIFSFRCLATIKEYLQIAQTGSHWVPSNRVNSFLSSRSQKTGYPKFPKIWDTLMYCKVLSSGRRPIGNWAFDF